MQPVNVTQCVQDATPVVETRTMKLSEAKTPVGLQRRVPELAKALMADLEIAHVNAVTVCRGLVDAAYAMHLGQPQLIVLSPRRGEKFNDTWMERIGKETHSRAVVYVIGVASPAIFTGRQCRQKAGVYLLDSFANDPFGVTDSVQVTPNPDVSRPWDNALYAFNLLVTHEPILNINANLTVHIHRVHAVNAAALSQMLEAFAICVFEAHQQRCHNGYDRSFDMKFDQHISWTKMHQKHFNAFLEMHRKLRHLINRDDLRGTRFILDNLTDIVRYSWEIALGPEIISLMCPRVGQLFEVDWMNASVHDGVAIEILAPIPRTGRVRHIGSLAPMSPVRQWRKLPSKNGSDQRSEWGALVVVSELGTGDDVDDDDDDGYTSDGPPTSWDDEEVKTPELTRLQLCAFGCKSSGLTMQASSPAAHLTYLTLK